MFKAQADIVSAIIVVLLALSLTSAALLWGLPLIQKQQDMRLVERVNNAFNQELPSRIEGVARSWGSDRFSLDVDGIWFLNETENTVSFTFFSKVSDKGTDQWIGMGCDPEQGFVGQGGRFGIDKPSIICAKAMQTGSGFNITYKIGYRELLNIDETKFYKIKLVKSAGGVSSSTGKDITISFKNTKDESTEQKTLIITEIEILL